MRFSLSNLIMPHYCCSCGEIGAILCEYCKYNIINDCKVECLSCERPVGRYGDVCAACSTAYARGWMVGPHRGALRELIGAYKFHSTRAVGVALGELLNGALPELPNDVIITSIPTVRSHVRERGFDHAVLMAKSFAHSRGMAYTPTLLRCHNTTQRGSGRRDRVRQASVAFQATKHLSGGTYLIIDDVCTTGATVHYAAKALKNAGAHEVWVAVISKEPLD